MRFGEARIRSNEVKKLGKARMRFEETSIGLQEAKKRMMTGDAIYL